MMLILFPLSIKEKGRCHSIGIPKMLLGGHERLLSSEPVVTFLEMLRSTVVEAHGVRLRQTPDRHIRCISLGLGHEWRLGWRPLGIRGPLGGLFRTAGLGGFRRLRAFALLGLLLQVKQQFITRER